MPSATIKRLSSVCKQSSLVSLTLPISVAPKYFMGNIIFYKGKLLKQGIVKLAIEIKSKKDKIKYLIWAY
jgi:hypothetical protein